MINFQSLSEKQKRCLEEDVGILIGAYGGVSRKYFSAFSEKQKENQFNSVGDIAIAYLKFRIDAINGLRSTSEAAWPSFLAAAQQRWPRFG